MARESSSFPHPLYEEYVLKPFFKDAETYYYRPMLAANRAHVVMLCRCGIITRANAAALLNALAQVDASRPRRAELPAQVLKICFSQWKTA